MLSLWGLIFQERILHKRNKLNLFPKLHKNMMLYSEHTFVKHDNKGHGLCIIMPMLLDKNCFSE